MPNSLALATVDPLSALRLGHQEALERWRNLSHWGAVIVFVIVVAVVAVLAIGVLAYISAYCIQRGGNLESFFNADWRGLTVELRFSCRFP
jgi:hypothetical protein